MHSYHEGVTGLLRTAWHAPAAVPPPPGRVWRDWMLVVLVVLIAVFEAALRTDLSQPLVAGIIVVAAAPTLLWRRTRPLLMLAIAFSVTAVATLLLGDSILYTSGFVILIPYLGVFVYLIARGHKMQEHAVAAAQAQDQAARAGQ